MEKGEFTMVIEKLVVKTGTACTLKCEKCGEFNPYLASKDKSYMISAEVLSKNIYKIAKAVEKIKLLQLTGGESLLHKDMFLLLAYICTIPNIEAVEMVTNGTVVPDAITLDLLRDFREKIEVLVSDYSGSGINNSKVIETLKNNKINHRVMRNMKWLDRSDVSDKKKNIEELEYIAQNCASYRKFPFYILNNGIITAHCCTAGSILYYLDIYEECKENYFNIEDVGEDDMLAELERINEVKFMQMCNYCIPSWDVKYCQAGKQID